MRVRYAALCWIFTLRNSFRVLPSHSAIHQIECVPSFFDFHLFLCSQIEIKMHQQCQFTNSWNYLCLTAVLCVGDFHTWNPLLSDRTPAIVCHHKTWRGPRPAKGETALLFIINMTPQIRELYRQKWGQVWHQPVYSNPFFCGNPSLVAAISSAITWMSYKCVQGPTHVSFGCHLI